MRNQAICIITLGSLLTATVASGQAQRPQSGWRRAAAVLFAALSSPQANQSRQAQTYSMARQRQEVENDPLSAFPPNVRQFIAALLRQAPADSQEQNLIAIQRLSPEGVQRALDVILGYANSGRLNTYLEYAAISEYIRAHFVQPNYQQAFVDGLWGVSPAEEQFALRVFQIVTQKFQGSIGGARPSPVLPGSLGGGIDPNVFQQGQQDLECSWLPGLPSCRRRR